MNVKTIIVQNIPVFCPPAVFGCIPKKMLADRKIDLGPARRFEEKLLNSFI